MIKWSFLFFLLLALTSYSQTTTGLIAHIAFDDCTADESIGDNTILGVITGNPQCECGVQGRALRFNGVNDHVVVGGAVNSLFATQDFTISLYFKSLGVGGVRTLLHKTGNNCNNRNTLAIRYDANTRFLNVLMIEDSSKTNNINRVPVPAANCWNHIVVVRQNNRTTLYLNGTLVADATSNNRVQLRNDGNLTIAKSYCPTTDRDFEGLIDEIRIYNRALNQQEIGQLYIPIDKIETEDTRIFLGETVDVNISNTCANQFMWSPADGVFDVRNSTTSLSPTETTTYTLSFIGPGCTATDTIQITVIDPNTLVCDDVYLPSAFTPTQDNLNDSYGLSNPEIFTFGQGELKLFEIFDRWGNVIFTTSDARQRWDGTYKGQNVNPGVFLYRVRHLCNGEEKTTTGSVTLLK